MSISKFIEEMRKIQSALLDFIDDEANEEINFQNLQDISKDIKISENSGKFKLFLYSLLNIANNFHRTANFFSKIDRILLYFKKYITKYFSNSEIFDFFKSNKRILLFLVEEKIMDFDDYILKQFKEIENISANYFQYFDHEITSQKFRNVSPENEGNMAKIRQILESCTINVQYQKKQGENDNYICELIRKDAIDDFVEYVNKNNIPITIEIKPSIFETNAFLLTQKNTNLIEYSVFFGSIQIFNYLRFNGVKLTTSLWLYAIHGRNAEIIHILEENEVEPEEKSYKKYAKKMNNLYKECLIESIKCNHNDLFEYIQVKSQIFDVDFKSIFKYYNFLLMKDEYINESLFYYLCKYNYNPIVNICNKIQDFNVSKPLVLTELIANIIQNY